MAKGSNLHLQQIRGPGLVAGGLPERFDNICLLEVLEMSGEIQSRIRQVEFGAYPFRVVVRDVFGQTFRLDLVSAFERDSSLDRMLELSNVSAPHVILEQLHSLW